MYPSGTLFSLDFAKKTRGKYFKKKKIIVSLNQLHVNHFYTFIVNHFIRLLLDFHCLIRLSFYLLLCVRPYIPPLSDYIPQAESVPVHNEGY